MHLDNELRGTELEMFIEHLSSCGDCWAQFSERQSFLESIRLLRGDIEGASDIYGDAAGLVHSEAPAGPVSEPVLPPTFGILVTLAFASLMLWRVVHNTELQIPPNDRYSQSAEGANGANSPTIADGIERWMAILFPTDRESDRDFARPGQQSSWIQNR